MRRLIILAVLASSLCWSQQPDRQTWRRDLKDFVPRLF